MRQIFRERCPADKTSLTLAEFKKIMPNKNVSSGCVYLIVHWGRQVPYQGYMGRTPYDEVQIYFPFSMLRQLAQCGIFRLILVFPQEFFVQRAFQVFDKDGDGTISLAEFLDTMSEFSKQGHMEKIMFLFKIYDIDGEKWSLTKSEHI